MRVVSLTDWFKENSCIIQTMRLCHTINTLSLMRQKNGLERVLTSFQWGFNYIFAPKDLNNK